MVANQNALGDQNVEYVPIKVTAGILLHIGAGIYQSVAGALKELVANAYDADARQVIISTDYPRFEQIKVVDDGSGMTSSRFKQAMATIGSSLKGVLTPNRRTPIFDRPIIGRLGIGLMSLSQICTEAVIESQARGSNTKFVAKLNFLEFKKKADADVDSITVEILQERYGGLAEMNRLLKDRRTSPEIKGEIRSIFDLLEKIENTDVKSDVEGEQLGYCILYPDLPAIPGEHGTTITLNSIDSTVSDSLRDIGRTIETLPKPVREKYSDWSEYRDEINGWSWEILCDKLRTEAGHLSYQLLPKYHQFLWELSLMTPVQYLPDGPVTIRPEVVRSKKKELEQLEFSLSVDNRYLSKPILLPSGSLSAREEVLQEGYDYNIEPFKFNKKIDGETLKYSGYIFWQRNQVQPSAIRGIEIYIRNVGIGLYDYTFMNFATVNLSSRAGQMSGEIYVEEGLERALNVDRNSFRETDDHYIALQQQLWNILGTAARGAGLIGKSIDAYWIRKERSDEQEQTEHIGMIGKLVHSASRGKYDVSFSDEERNQPYEVKRNHIIVYDRSPRWPRSKQERRLCQRMLIPAKVAIAAGTSPDQVLDLLESILLK